MKKELAAGVAHKKVIAPMVDPKGAFTKVQERTIGNMKKGGIGGLLSGGGISGLLSGGGIGGLLSGGFGGFGDSGGSPLEAGVQVAKGFTNTVNRSNLNEAVKKVIGNSKISVPDFAPPGTS